jgi:siroheme synthase-like protein
MSYYPIAVDLTGKTVLVVGGGEVALRKVERLAEYNARVIVVAPEVVPEMMTMAEAGKIELKRNRYSATDLAGVLMVIAATDDQDVNRRVADEARGLNILVNVVDVPELCSFIVPASVKRGDLTISINTAGKSPALAKMVREKCEDMFGEYYGDLTDLLGELREMAKAQISSQPEREKLFTSILNSEVPDLIRKGQREQARGLALNLLANTEHRCIL